MKTVLIIIVLTLVSNTYIYAGSKGSNRIQKTKPTFIMKRQFNPSSLANTSRLHATTLPTRAGQDASIYATTLPTRAGQDASIYATTLPTRAGQDASISLPLYATTLPTRAGHKVTVDVYPPTTLVTPQLSDSNPVQKSKDKVGTVSRSLPQKALTTQLLHEIPKKTAKKVTFNLGTNDKNGRPKGVKKVTFDVDTISASTLALKSIPKNKTESNEAPIPLPFGSPTTAITLGSRLSEATKLMNKGQIAAADKDYRLKVEGKKQRKNYIEKSLLDFKQTIFDTKRHLGLKGENIEVVFEEYQKKYGKSQTNRLKDISDGTYTKRFQALQHEKLRKILKKENKHSNKLIKFLTRTSLTKKEVQFKNDSENGNAEIKNMKKEEYLTELFLEKSWNNLKESLEKNRINPSTRGFAKQKIRKSWNFAKKTGQKHMMKAITLKYDK